MFGKRTLLAVGLALFVAGFLHGFTFPLCLTILLVLTVFEIETVSTAVALMAQPFRAPKPNQIDERIAMMERKLSALSLAVGLRPQGAQTEK